MRKSFFPSLLLAAALMLGGAASAQTLQEGLRLVNVERYGDAGRVFRQIVAASPSADNYFYYGYALAQADKPDSAIAIWTMAGEKDAKSALGKVALGSAAILKGDKATAAAQFGEALKLSKNKNAEVFYRIGEAYTVYPTNDAGMAIQHLTKAAELDKARPDILVTLGDAYLIPNDGSAAATNYDRAIRLSRNYTKAYIRIGQVYERARSYTEAYNKYKEGMSIDSSYTPGYRYMAELQRKARRQELAIANYRKYIQRSDRNPEALLRFAGFLIEAGQYQEAAQYVKEVEGKTKSPIYNRLKAYVAYETGDAAGAEQALSQFMATTDTAKTKIIGRDYFYLGKAALATSKDTAKGIALMKQGIAKDTNLVGDIKLLGDSAFNKKQYRAATAFYQAYVQTKAKARCQRVLQARASSLFRQRVPRCRRRLCQGNGSEPGPRPGRPFLSRVCGPRAEDPDNKHGHAAKHFCRVFESNLRYEQGSIDGCAQVCQAARHCLCLSGS